MAVESIESYRFRAFGLDVLSELSVTGAAPLDSAGRFDVRITGRKKIADLPNSRRRKKWRISKNQALYDDGESTRFLAEDGKQIFFQENSLLNTDRLLSNAFASLLLQRGTFLLHGATLAFEKSAYAFIGVSGTGKSTLALALSDAGMDFMGDDVVVCSIEQGIVHAQSSLPRIKLCEDSIDQVASGREWSELATQPNKKMSVVQSWIDQKLPVVKIFLLNPTKCEQVSIAESTGLEKITGLKSSMFRTALSKELLGREKIWEYLQYLTRIPIFQIDRPFELSSVDEMSTKIQRIIDH